jgi:hypothetical protein
VNDARRASTVPGNLHYPKTELDTGGRSGFGKQ